MAMARTTEAFDTAWSFSRSDAFQRKKRLTNQAYEEVPK